MFCLRELERKDLEIINGWRNDPELIEMLGAPFRYINLDVDIKWYESYMNNRGSAVRCAIVEEGDDGILGLVSLVSVNYMNQSAEFHIMIGDKENRGRGLGTFAVNAMLDHAFNNMNLQRVELTVLEDNERARFLYEYCGFVYEGRKRKAKYKNGKFVDMLMYSILKSEFVNRERGGVSCNFLPVWCIDRITERCEIDSIIRKCDKAFDEPVSGRAMYSDLLEKIYNKGIFISVYKEQPMGYCAFYANDTDNKTAYISLIAVDPDYQGMQIGTYMLDSVIEIAALHDMTSCVLEVKKKNFSAIQFYRSNGFVFLEEKENSFLMKRKLLSVKGKTYEHKGKKSNITCNGKK